jgi:hypothetical protein
MNYSTLSKKVFFVAISQLLCIALQAAEHQIISSIFPFALKSAEDQELDYRLERELDPVYKWMYQKRRNLVKAYYFGGEYTYYEFTEIPPALIAAANVQNDLIQENNLSPIELQGWCNQVTAELSEHQVVLKTRTNMGERYKNAKDEADKEHVMRGFAQLFSHFNYNYFFALSLGKNSSSWWEDQACDWEWHPKSSNTITYPDEQTEAKVCQLLSQKRKYFENKRDNLVGNPLEKFSTRDLAEMLAWLRAKTDLTDKKYSFIQNNTVVECSLALTECMRKVRWLAHEMAADNGPHGPCIRAVPYGLPSNKWKMVHNVRVAYAVAEDGTEVKKPWYAEQNANPKSEYGWMICDTVKHIYSELDKAPYSSRL